MSYTWDPKKNRRNLTLHGVAFEDAVRIFDRWMIDTSTPRFACTLSAS